MIADNYTEYQYDWARKMMEDTRDFCTTSHTKNIPMCYQGLKMLCNRKEWYTMDIIRQRNIAAGSSEVPLVTVYLPADSRVSFAVPVESITWV